MLKSIILHRKNSLFFKSQLGATIADILISILFTAKENDLNSVEYLIKPIGNKTQKIGCLEIILTPLLTSKIILNKKYLYST
jgi:hypothetical protein